MMKRSVCAELLLTEFSTLTYQSVRQSLCTPNNRSAIHVVDKPGLFELLDDTRIDEVFRLVIFGPGSLRGDFVQDRLNPFRGRIRRLFIERRTYPVGFLENLAIARAEQSGRA